MMATTWWVWMEESAINGVAHTARAMRDKHYSRAALWMAVTVGLWVVTSYLLYGVVRDYRSYPVLTTVEVDYQNNGVDFPTVQLCNHNPIKCSDLFQVSFELEALWKATGCRVGVQIQGYISKVLTDFELDLNSTEMVEFAPVIPDLYGDTDKTAPMVNLWAHHYIESQAVAAMVMKPAFGKMFARLETYVMNATVDSPRRLLWNKTTAYYKHAVDHLQKARRLWTLRKQLLPRILIVNAESGDYSNNGLSRGTDIAQLMAKMYLRFYSPDNLEDDIDLRTTWLNAISTNNTEYWENNRPDSRILNVTAGFTKFFEQEILQPLQDVPSVLWLYGRPKATRNCIDILLKNTNLALTWISPSSNSSMSPALLATIQRISSKAVDLIDTAGTEGIGLLLQDDYVIGGKDFARLALRQLNDLIKLTSTKMDDFVRTCTFRGKPCNRTDIDQVLSLKYGLCYVFNPHTMVSRGNLRMEPKRTFGEGLAGGLTLLLAIHEQEYIRVPNQVLTTGARIAISPHGSPLNIEEEGVDLVPGQSTSISLREMAVERLPSPYPSDCQMNWSDSPYRFFDYVYDYNTCRRFCVAHQILEKCGCIDSSSNAQDLQFQNGTGVSWNVNRWCDYTKPTTKDSLCAATVRLREDADKLAPAAKAECACRPACQLKGYEMRTSAASFPARGSMERLAESASLHPFSLEHNWELIKNSLVEVKIYFSSFDLQRTTEEPRHTPLSMAADVGGAIGLLLGLCGINIIEIVVMGWDLVTGARLRTNVTATNGHGVATVARDGRRLDVKPLEPGLPPHHPEALSSKRLALMQAAAALDQEIARQHLFRTRREVTTMVDRFGNF